MKTMKSLSQWLAFAACVCLVSQRAVAEKGEVRLGNLKAEKILFLGNSMTAVPQLNMPTWWGLSASTVAKDYVHLLVGAIDAKTGGHLTLLPTTAPVTNADGSVDQCDSNVINVADVFERGYASYDPSRIKKQLAWKADLVILQFGENIPPTTFNAEVFNAALKKLVADLKDSSNPHIFMASHILGANPTVDEMKRKLCAEDPTHRVFIDLTHVAKDPANMGAYGHPGDQGMALISETMFQAIIAHSAATATATSQSPAPAAEAKK
jgi:lysophospholipase L1-like esterase